MKRFRVLVVDDNVTQLEVIKAFLQQIDNVNVVSKSDPLAARELLASDEKFDLLITDIHMPEMDGIELLKFAKQQDSNLIVLVISSSTTFDLAVEALRGGAFDYIAKPVNAVDLITKVRNIIAKRRTTVELEAVEAHYLGINGQLPFIGNSAGIEKVKSLADKIATKDIDVIITGETGTGKELLARYIHAASQRNSNRFVPFDCSAIPETLLESELFGYRQGTFTGATKNRLGIAEFADKGTLFLDEIGEMPKSMQAKLLRVLQERAVRPLGAKEERNIDIRVIAATARNLHDLAQKGEFREDLYYRLEGATLELPPLRDRGHDIMTLAKHFLNQSAAKMNKPVTGINDDAAEVIGQYAWPGNIRQLLNTVKYAIAMCKGETIEIADLPDRIVLETTDLPAAKKKGFFKLREAHMTKFEKDYIKQLIIAHDGQVSPAADEAMLPRGTLYRLIKKHGLDLKEFKEKT